MGFQIMLTGARALVTTDAEPDSVLSSGGG